MQSGSLVVQTALISSAQNILSTWADLGTEKECLGKTKISLWCELDNNNCANARLRVLGKGGVSGTTLEYVIPYSSTSDYYEFTADEDQKRVVTFDLPGSVPKLQVQCQAGTQGATPGQFDSLYYSMFEI